MHTPWQRVPVALWAMRYYLIVRKPFAAGFAIGLGLTAAAILLTMFEQQKLHGQARWVSLREIREGKLMAATGIVLGRRGRSVL